MQTALTNKMRAESDRVERKGKTEYKEYQNKLHARKAYRSKILLQCCTIYMAWSRTQEGIQEARVAKHAFEEFAVQFDVVPNDNQWQI